MKRLQTKKYIRCFCWLTLELSIFCQGGKKNSIFSDSKRPNRTSYNSGITMWSTSTDCVDSIEMSIKIGYTDQTLHSNLAFLMYCH